MDLARSHLILELYPKSLVRCATKQYANLKILSEIYANGKMSSSTSQVAVGIWVRYATKPITHSMMGARKIYFNLID